MKAAGKFVSVILWIIIFSGLSTSQVLAFDYIWWEAENYDEGANWPGGQAGTGWFAPQNDTERAKLSEGVWLNIGPEPAEAPWCRYNLEIPTSGDYEFYVRRFYHHGDFRYKFDDDAWTDVTENIPFLDSVPIRTNVVANWISLGTVNLDAGSHTFEFEILDKSKAAGMDCFLLANGPFNAAGVLKPGEKTGLHIDGVNWAFEPGYDSFDSGAALDLSYLNEDVAGQSGRVTSANGRFYLGNGQPVRFWGTNIGTGGLSMNLLEYNAKRLAKLGVNHVRYFVNIFPTDASSSVTDVNEDTIDNCHKIVAAMKEEGIYTKICPFFVLSLTIRDGWNITGADSNQDQPFALLFFDDDMKAAYKGWISELMTRTNPHTGLTLAEDPAVYLFQIQNEDSFFFWTFVNNLNDYQKNELGRQFGDWLIAKYGSLDDAFSAWGGSARTLTTGSGGAEWGDDFANGIAGYYEVYHMTSDQWAYDRGRVYDQIQFFAEKQIAFNNEMEDYLRALGYEGLVSANNWKTADNVTLYDVERYTYTANQVIDAHHYFSCTHENPSEPNKSSYQVNQGDFYIPKSTLLNPRSLPTNYKMILDYPHIISETTWVQPNRFRSEGTLLAAAYAAMSDLDGFFWFASGSIDYDISMTKFQVNMPDIMGQFPAAALIYREGLVQEAPVVVYEERSLESMWQKKTPVIAEDSGYDPVRDLDDPPLNGETSASPLSYLVGKVRVKYDGDEANNEVMDLSSYIDEENKIVTSITDELRLDYANGLFTINTPRAQAAVGFLQQAGAIALDDVIIDSQNEYGAVAVVAMDGQPIADSRKLLVQSMTESRHYEWEAIDDTYESQSGKTITNIGRQPWNVVNTDCTVIITNGSLNNAISVDAMGYEQASLSGNLNGANYTITLPQDSMYTIVSGPESMTPPRFGGDQQVEVGSGGNFRAVAWNYTQSDFVAEMEDYGFGTLEYPLATSEWICCALYDLDAGQWIEGIYVFKEQWVLPSGFKMPGVFDGVPCEKGYIPHEAPAFPGPDSVVYNEIQSVNLQGGNYSVGAWSYTEGDWSAKVDRQGIGALSLPVRPGEWTAVVTYDYSAQNWTEAIYFYKQSWQ
ncbi:MAG: hypothetical protein ACLFQ6_00760 [Candidatus Sumerlaeia bacterium]